jgi:predicted MFS family arabinose efflux permease
VRRILPADPLTTRLGVATLVSAVGNGMFITVSALFFTRVVGLSTQQVGVGLTLAGACAVVVGIPIGRAADRWGSHRLLVAIMIGEAAGTGTYVVVRTFAGFLAVVSMVAVMDRSATAVRATMLAMVLPEESRVAARSFLRAVSNVGFWIGSGCLALALQADTRAAYLDLVVADAVTFLIAAVLTASLPGPARRAAGGRPRAPGGRQDRRAAAPLRNPSYVVISLLNGVLTLQFAVLEIGLPLWVAQDTTAPRLVVAGALVVNTAIVAATQVRAGRSAVGLNKAARVCRRGALALTVACIGYGFSAHLSPVAAAVAVLAAAGCQSTGEVLTSAGGWTMSYDLADPGAPGAYQAVYNSGFTLATMCGPALVTSTAIALGLSGWVILAAIFLSAGLALPPATRWADCARTATK